MSQGQKQPIEKAKKIAELINQHIKIAANRSEIAGSIRRNKAEVSDLEIVTICDNRESLKSLISDFGVVIKPGTPDIIPWQYKFDAKYIRIWIPDEMMKLDLFMATPENWGGLFMMRTGSGVGPSGHPQSGFTPGMFSRWKKVSSGGRMINARPSLPSGEILSVPEEQDVFDLCKVTYIPPELRSDKSIIKNYSYL